jgi:hypothetical protein
MGWPGGAMRDMLHSMQRSKVSGFTLPLAFLALSGPLLRPARIR